MISGRQSLLPCSPFAASLSRHSILPHLPVPLINPIQPLVITSYPPSTPSPLPTSSFSYTTHTGQLDHIPRPTPSASYISLHDTSYMHIHAALHPASCNGHRFLLAAWRAPPQALADFIRTIRPQWRDRIPEGTPGEGYAKGYGWMESGVSIDCERARKALGLGEGGKEWMGWEESVRETVEGLERWYRKYL
ncbi:MAG: hypothetical protein Q9181_003874 [Wetmoreana brouardii]